MPCDDAANKLSHTKAPLPRRSATPASSSMQASRPHEKITATSFVRPAKFMSSVSDVSQTVCLAIWEPHRHRRKIYDSSKATTGYEDSTS